MSAREELITKFANFMYPRRFSWSDAETEATEMVDAYRAEILREAAEKIRTTYADLKNGGVTGNSLWRIVDEIAAEVEGQA